MAQQAPPREWFEKDYYKVLGVPEHATQKEIKAAYRRLSKQYHPDQNPGSEERFKEVSSAYDVIGDSEKRKQYDEMRRLGPMGFAGGGGGFTAGPGAEGFTFVGDLGDLGDLFGGLFGRGRAARGRGAGPARGDDLETELHLSFLDAVNGVTTTVHVTSESTCSTCHGAGAAPGTSPVVCPRCAGRGTIEENQGPFSFSQPCPQCGGRGMIVEKACPTCRGSGVAVQPRQVKVRVPAGVEDAQRIRLKGTFAEAALGAEVKVPTLAEPVTLRVPAGTSTGKTFRVRGRGVPQARGGAGDLLVTVDVAVPKNLSKAEREAIEALAEVSTESPRGHLGV